MSDEEFIVTTADMLEIVAGGGNGVELVNITALLEQAAKELREKDDEIAEWEEAHKGRCKDWLYWKDQDARLREENARLREAVKNAYYEGWQDNASIDDTEDKSIDRLDAEWEHCEARAAIREGGKDEN